MALWRITNTFFTGLINRLGIRPPPRDGFSIQDTVVPVALVDADISIPVAESTPLIDIPFTQGALAAPAAGTLVADTGPQIAGNYLVICNISSSGAITTTASFIVQRRDAANAVTVWSTFAQSGSGSQLANDPWFFTFRLVLLTNERLRIIVDQAVAAGQTVLGNIWLTPS